MVNQDWIEGKILQLERDKGPSTWIEIREQKLRYLYEINWTGKFLTETYDQINIHLTEVFYGTKK